MGEDPNRSYHLYVRMLLRAGRQYLNAAQFKAEAYDLSGAEGLLLVLIDQLGEPRWNALLEATGLEESSLGGLLGRLETAGLVFRKDDPVDRHLQFLGLTPAGQALAPRMQADLARVRKAVLAEVGTTDLEASLRMYRVAQTRGCGIHDATDPSTSGLSKGQDR